MDGEYLKKNFMNHETILQIAAAYDAAADYDWSRKYKKEHATEIDSILKMVEEFIEKRTALYALDVGGGVGIYSIELAHNPEIHCVHLIDISARSLLFAEAMIKHKNLHNKIACIKSNFLDRKSEYFKYDIILAIGVSYHITSYDDLDTLLNNIRNSMHKNSRCFISFLNIKKNVDHSQYLYKKTASTLPLFFVSLKYIINTLKKYGFYIISSSGIENTFFTKIDEKNDFKENHTYTKILLEISISHD
jgi:2-polyprenyl-3-methyl-5-hydroxy-6-metoxy-1,4-benzoquinol methylase